MFIDGVQFQAVSAITARDLMIQEQSTSLLGTYLGWLMAAIYMGGRLPQIYLNVRSQNPLSNV